MVVVAFLVPLFILVSDLARDSALSEGERDAETLARILSVLTVSGTLEDAIATVGEERIEDVRGSVILPDGAVIGADIPPNEDLTLATAGTSFLAPTEGGIAVYVPVLMTDGSTAVVRAFVPDSVMREGVMRSWAILAALGFALVVIAAWVADRLGRSMVQPVNALAAVANRLGHGELGARVEPSGPSEVEEVGREFNRLADQIGRLLQQERESVADLAHRLRTPLTAARLSIEGLDEGRQKDRLSADMDDLQRTTDFIIREARRPVRREELQGSDIAAVLRDRLAFWEPLASDQQRRVSTNISEEPMPVPIPLVDTEAVIDALIENVLSHTPEGTPFAVTLEREGTSAVLVVEDAGPGFTDTTAVERGTSRGDSTGLGLDIVRRTVENNGGTIAIGQSILLDGAAIVIRLDVDDR